MARRKTKVLPPKMITVYAEILQETELAILVRCDEDADGVWLPKSQIKYSGERGDTGVEIEIPELMADEKGFFDGMGRPEVKVSPAPEAPADKRSFGDNVKWLKKEKITVSQPLSDSEKARYAEEMSALDKEIKALKDERAEVSNHLKNQIDVKEKERLELSSRVMSGEVRTITCDCLKDYNTGEMVWTDAFPPYAEVQRRKMTKEEMQHSLLEYSEMMAASAPAEEGAEPFEPADTAPDGEGVDFDAMADAPTDAEDAESDASAENAAAEDDAPGCTSCAHQDSGDDESCDGSGDLNNYTPVAADTEAASQGAGAVQ